jgi:hypothetical protein
MREVDRLIERNIAANILVYKPEEIKERLGMGEPFIKKYLRKGKSSMADRRLIIEWLAKAYQDYGFASAVRCSIKHINAIK